MRQNDIDDRKDIVLKMIQLNKSKADICRFLHCRITTLNNWLKRHSIKYLGNQGSYGIKGKGSKTYEQIINSSSKPSPLFIKLKLFSEGLKNKICECCGLSEWLGKPIPLELHHIDGNRYNNIFSNLQILCCNCHAMTDNYSGRKTSPEQRKHIKRILENNDKNVDEFLKPDEFIRIKRTKLPVNKRIKIISNCVICNKEFVKNTKKIKFCSEKCYRKERSKNIPKKDELIKAFQEYKSFLQVGKYFNVSDNAVRKWMNKYNLNKTAIWESNQD